MMGLKVGLVVDWLAGLKGKMKRLGLLAGEVLLDVSGDVGEFEACVIALHIRDSAQYLD